MKILVVDDHTLIREGLRLVLKALDDEIVVLEAQNCQETFELTEVNPDLDLILLDLHLPGIHGFDALTEVRDRHPAIPVVVLSAADNRETVIGALDRGAMGFVPKSSATRVILGALRLVLSGGVYLPENVLAHADLPFSEIANPPQDSPPRSASSPAELGLTERQAEVLALMVQGKPNKLICRELGVTEGTVKVHVSAILKALNVTNRTQAVIAIGRLGFKLDGIGSGRDSRGIPV